MLPLFGLKREDEEDIPTGSLISCFPLPRPENRKEPPVDNDRMLSLTGGGERKAGKRKREGTKSNGPFYIRARGIIGVKDRVAKRAENS